MRPALLLVCTLPLLGCGLGERRIVDVSDSFCAARLRQAVPSLPPPGPGEASRLLAGGFSADAIETAEAIGVLGRMQALIDTERRPGNGVPVILARQAVTDRVLLALLDVQATLATIDCEGERADQLRGQLQRNETRRARNLGLAGILIGAGTAALTGGLSLAGAAAAGDTVGIIGGSAEAAVASTLLFGSTSGLLRTRTNLLAEIHRQPAQSSLFPPTVWRYLTRRDAPGEPNIAEEIVAEWRAAGLLDGEPELDPLFLGEARLAIEDLERRDAMLDLTEARIALMSRDLRQLLEEVTARPVPTYGRGRRAGPP
ncbi:hypothetical protein [Sediminicoccus sp. KRV36]|uniref:hypothetical protein n=1 Tax=Sediminicoccus sp. KRV36 TaxID=3133721 RepID=UPI00200F4CEA|nr:hypothetical protein [Sediminicoccus rosea]UPY37489.1 hypothetical protein LHU95_02010 [Sediminicoccus rosea]